MGNEIATRSQIPRSCLYLHVVMCFNILLSIFKYLMAFKCSLKKKHIRLDGLCQLICPMRHNICAVDKIFFFLVALESLIKLFIYFIQARNVVTI